MICHSTRALKRTFVARWLVAIVVGATALVVFAGVAGATGTLDQSQTSASAGVETIPSVPGGRLGQTFTAGLTGGLDQVDLLLVRNGSPGPLTVEIRATSAGVPTTTVLATATLTESSVPLNVPGWVSVPFSTPAASHAGIQYGIVISAPGIDCGSICYQWGTALGDPYAGGEALDSVDGGTSWFSPGLGLERAFQTYVTVSLPTSLEQCMNDGWQKWPQFKNQGDCVSFVASGGKNLPG